MGSLGNSAVLVYRSTFDPEGGHTAGINFSHVLWVRCGRTKAKLPPLEQAFKVADILFQNSSFTLIVVNISRIGERLVRRIPLSTWFRFCRVVERQSTAFVFIEQEPHATSCTELVNALRSRTRCVTGQLVFRLQVQSRILRNGAKKFLAISYAANGLMMVGGEWKNNCGEASRAVGTVGELD
jgi:hypothetical protein